MMRTISKTPITWRCSITYHPFFSTHYLTKAIPVWVGGGYASAALLFYFFTFDAATSLKNLGQDDSLHVWSDLPSPFYAILIQ